jgi:hypothetical protein
MEQLTETVTLDMEEANELAFKIKVEGASTPAKVRLVCESPEVSYMFVGRGTGEDGVVQFVIPQMKGKLQEGTYAARVEVLIENRYFSPVQFQLNFKKTMQVFAESIQHVQPVKPEIRVSASPIVVQQTRIEPQRVPAKIQERPIQQVVAQKPQQQKPLQRSVESAVPPQAPAKTHSDNTHLTLREKFNRLKSK